LLGIATGAAAVVDISNAISPWEPAIPAAGVRIDTAVGAGNSGRLVGITQTHWSSGGVSVPLNLNANTLIIDSGGGNAMNVTGAISGNGSITIASGPWWGGTWNNPVVIGGTTANTYTGTTGILGGTAKMSKTAGVDALLGNITVGSSSNSARLVWGASNQINNLATINVLLPTVSGGAAPDANLNYLDLAGYSDTIKSLTLADAGTKTQVRTGAGGVITVRQLMVNGTLLGLGTYTSASGFVTGTGSVVVVAGPAVDIPAGYTNPNVAADLGNGIQNTAFNLLGDATFGDATGTLAGNVSINDPARTLTLATGGNSTVLLGALSGSGNLVLDADNPAGVKQEDAPFKLIPWPKKVELGSGRINLAAGRIIAVAPSLLPLAGILASDIQRVYQVTLATAQAAPAAGDIVMSLVTGDPSLDGTDAYRITVDDRVTIAGETYQAIAMGMMTVLQALHHEAATLMLERMTIEDHADRGLRALQVDIRGGYHSPAWVKKVIDLMRIYKVRVLQLHTTESMWVSAVMDSSNGTDPNLLKQNSAWSKQEMEGVIDYAIARGVSLMPHNEMRPNDPFWPAALTTDFNTTDAFACYVDEIDHLGPYVMPANLENDVRFWSFLRVVTQRCYDQFARSWPGGVLPYYHIGPVYGEGGCSGPDAVKMLGYLMEKNPAIRMMYWNGPGVADPDLTPHKNNIIVDFYSSTWGGTPDGLLAAGYQLNNVSWTPLYIQPGTRLKALRQGKWIFDEFHISRFGNEGTFGEPINAIDCSLYQNGVVGSLLPTWDFSGPDQGEGHLDMISPCIPYFAEHIWNVHSWPYSACAWDNASAAQTQIAPLANLFLSDPRPSSAPGNVTATVGVLPAAVDVLWAESDNYPVSYQVYRADTNNSAVAQPVSGMIAAAFVTGINSFRDLTVTPGKNYYYWVRSFNPAGVSAFSLSARGVTGAGATLPVAGESFDYPAGAALASLAGGTGFGTGWVVDEFNAPLTISATGLTYPGLLTSGRALHVEATDADETNGRVPPYVRIHRDMTNTYGQDGTQVWTAYLLRGTHVGIGDFAANIGRIGYGKGWGSGFFGGGGDMVANKTYLLVSRYTFHNGNDLVHMWLNPTPGTQPADTDAAYITRQEENPTSSTFALHMQPYGLGSYDIDEIRVGRSYAEVVPVGP